MTRVTKQITEVEHAGNTLTIEYTREDHSATIQWEGKPEIPEETSAVELGEIINGDLQLKLLANTIHVHLDPNRITVDLQDSSGIETWGEGSRTTIVPEPGDPFGFLSDE